ETFGHPGRGRCHLGAEQLDDEVDADEADADRDPGAEGLPELQAEQEAEQGDEDGQDHGGAQGVEVARDGGEERLDDALLRAGRGGEAGSAQGPGDLAGHPLLTDAGEQRQRPDHGTVTEAGTSVVATTRSASISPPTTSITLP